MEKDQPLKAVSNELSKNLTYAEFAHEITWLSRFGAVCVENCTAFIQSEFNIAKLTEVTGLEPAQIARAVNLRLSS